MPRLDPWLAAALLLTAACSAPTDQLEHDVREAPGYRQRVFHLEAPCTINVEGVGPVDIEEDYIPGVVACENGGAPLEALKAQAVQARSFLYYKIFVQGQTTIRNSTADQVYSCSYRPNGPDAIHRQAAEETRAQYLTWDNSIVAAFYVAGAIPPNPNAADPWGSCMGNGGSDPTSTQRWVTYNRGKTGCNVELTDLGFVPADCRDNPHNRGCASQNGEACLAGLGIGYRDMLKYHYGDDIVLEVGEGRCGATPPSAEDQFCIDNGDGSHCFDAATRIECSGGAASMTEACADGCGEGACLVPPAPTFCTELANGAYCDGANAVTCAAAAIAATEACPGGCAGGACVPPATGNNDVIDPPNNGTGGTTGPDDEDPDGPAAAPGANAVPPTIGPSPGIDGGCATASGGGGLGALLFALLFSGIGTRRSRAARWTPRANRPR